MKKETAERILMETEWGYDLISTKFSQTRKFFWRGLEFIGDYAKNGDTVLDFGCGNGRLLELIGNIENMQYHGVDVSQNLINAAKNKYPNKNFSKISPIQNTLAFNGDFFNTIYGIAVFHHFPSEKYRQDWARELYRITKPQGRIIITVWNLWPASLRQMIVPVSRGGQKKYFKSILQNWIHKVFGRSELDWNDCHISFADNDGKKFQRFHHAFTKRELRTLFSEAGFRIEKCVTVSGKNILLIGKK